MLSASRMAVLPEAAHSLISSAAPLLGLVSTLGLGVVMRVLPVDAVAAPMGTANVHAAVTARILYARGVELRGGGLLTRLNRRASPATAPWMDAAVGLPFLLRFPACKQLLALLRSVVLFSCLAGSARLRVLERTGLAGAQASAPRGRALGTRVIGVCGVLCCSWMVQRGGRFNPAGRSRRALSRASGMRA